MASLLLHRSTNIFPKYWVFEKYAWVLRKNRLSFGLPWVFNCLSLKCETETTSLGYPLHHIILIFIATYRERDLNYAPRTTEHASTERKQISIWKWRHCLLNSVFLDDVIYSTTWGPAAHVLGQTARPAPGWLESLFVEEEVESVDFNDFFALFLPVVSDEWILISSHSDGLADNFPVRNVNSWPRPLSAAGPTHWV